MKSNHNFSIVLESKNSINNQSLEDMKRELSIILEIEEMFSKELENALVFIKNMSAKKQIVKINFDIEVQNLGDENA